MLKQTQAIASAHRYSAVEVAAVHQAELPAEERLDENRRVLRFRSWEGRRVPGRLLRKVARLLSWQLGVLNHYRSQALDSIHCHSLSTLPLGVALKALTGARLIYDTHELETESAESRGIRRRLSRITERAFIGRCDQVIVVGDAIGRWYRERYGLDNVHVVRNYPKAPPSAPERGASFRKDLGIPEGQTIFLYQGILADGRGIRQILEAFAHPDCAGRHLVLMGFGPLEPLAREFAERHSNIHFRAAVPPDRLLDQTRSADVGISLIENTCLSYYYCLPNKVFEYLMAGLPIIVSRFPEMSAVVETHGVGWTAEPTADDLARVVRSIDTQELERCRNQVLKTRSSFDWATQEPVYLRAVLP
jgi:glycosyltransferase involved in cell wall biosynthesis